MRLSGLIWTKIGLILVEMANFNQLERSKTAADRQQEKAVYLFDGTKPFNNDYWCSKSILKSITGRPRIWYQVLPVFFLFFFRW
jgi:hypothetical protein